MPAIYQSNTMGLPSCRACLLVSSARLELALLDPQARHKKKSGRWERPLKGKNWEVGLTKLFVGTGARLVPLSGTRSSEVRGTFRLDEALSVLAADEHLEFDAVRDGVHDHG